MLSRAQLEKLLVTQPVKKFMPFMEPESFLPCSQQPTNAPYPQQDVSNPQLPIRFPEDLL
jgi:hypothetical protein